MGNVLVKEETLTQIADAIREKSGTDDLYKPGEMPGAILEISTYSGEGADPNKPIRFYGPYGDLIYSYTFAEISELTELPPLPEYKGLVGQEWNWSLENILAEGSELEIASMYMLLWTRKPYLLKSVSYKRRQIRYGLIGEMAALWSLRTSTALQIWLVSNIVMRNQGIM